MRTPEEFLESLEAMIQPYHDQLVEHPAIVRIHTGEAPVDQIRRYLTYQYYNTRETVARILNRAGRAPNDEIRDMLIRHASEELGHPEMALRTAEHFGMDPEAIARAPVPFWIDYQVSWKWRMSCLGSFAENAAAVAVAEEGPFPYQCEKVREGLRRHYGVADERLLEYFTVHMMADKDHKENGRRILLRHATTEELRAKALTAARRNLTLMLRIHDEIDSGRWTM